MRSIRGTLNRIEMIGWLGQNPELKAVGKDGKVCTFSVGTKRMAGRTNGEPQYETEWLNVEAWDRLAERCDKALRQGSRVLVTGSVMTRSWEDKESGKRMYRTTVRASDCIFLSAHDSDDGDSDDGDDVTA
ncbi:MAG: single-stranded DNA-binding protein [Roseiflexaceae bacterium]|jgi:single-strand DNA-binding protein|nr:single-stranded DNA-binding protein [Chloroflexaceae bacterium]